MHSIAALSHNQQAKSLQHLAQSALTAYDLPETRLTPLRFTNNAIFKVETASAQANTLAYVLRIHRPRYRSSAETRSELQYIQALRREVGLALPEPVYTRQGDLITTASIEGIDEPRHCDLVTWLDGRVCRPHQGLGLKGTFRLGEALGRMHLFSQDFHAPPGFRLPRWDADGLFTEASSYKPGSLEALFSPADRADFMVIEQRTRATFRALGQKSQSFGVIHADFILGNCLFHKKKVQVVDFDDCGWGYFLYDMCRLLGNLKDYPEYPVLRRAFLAGYRSVHALPRELEDAVDVLIAARHASSCLWIAGCQGNGGMGPDIREHVAYRMEEMQSYLTASAHI
jgi:Ser/Thr protein kinase RdoA (MazF antagonist)